MVNKDHIDAYWVRDFFGEPQPITGGSGGNGGSKPSKHQKERSIAMKEKITPSVAMKRFHWQTVDYAAAKDSIWRTMDERAVTQCLDVQEFETLFCIPQRKPPQAADKGMSSVF